MLATPGRASGSCLPRERSWQANQTAANVREALVCRLTERELWRTRVRAGHRRGQRHPRVELTRGLGDEHVPLVNGLGCRPAPGAALQPPLALASSTLEE